MRGSLANLQAAIEMIDAYPEMGREDHQKFFGIIHEETQTLSTRFNQTIGVLANSMEVHRQMEEQSAVTKGLRSPPTQSRDLRSVSASPGERV